MGSWLSQRVINHFRKSVLCIKSTFAIVHKQIHNEAHQLHTHLYKLQRPMSNSSTVVWSQKFYLSTHYKCTYEKQCKCGTYSSTWNFNLVDWGWDFVLHNTKNVYFYISKENVTRKSWVSKEIGVNMDNCWRNVLKHVSWFELVYAGH